MTEASKSSSKKSKSSKCSSRSGKCSDKSSSKCRSNGSHKSKSSGKCSGGSNGNSRRSNGSRPSASSGAQRSNGSDKKNSDDEDDDDDDDRSVASGSTFSFIHSIMNRRRRVRIRESPPPSVREDEEDDDATAGGVVHKKRIKRKTKHRRKSQRANFNPIHAVILMALLGLASNWLATHILNATLSEEAGGGDEYVIEMETVANDDDRERDALYEWGNADAEGGEGRDALYDWRGAPAVAGVDRSEEEVGRFSQGDLDALRNSMGRSNAQYLRGDGRGGGGGEPPADAIERFDRGDLDRLRKSMGRSWTEADDRLSGVGGGDPAGPDDDDHRPAPLLLSVSKRFSNLRRRLLPLYSERAPSSNSSSPSSGRGGAADLHPLYNATSPQAKALDWLANVDGLRLRHNDPGLVQRYALAVMYFSTGGPRVEHDTDFSRKRAGPWRNPTNFLAPTHECEWKSRIIDGAGRGGGIRRCDKNKTVVEISLYNELTGAIPSELGRLWNLRTLYLGRNRLSGTIPTELGMIQKLSSLSLQWNDLSGTIPEEHLRNLNTLRALQLEGNERIRGKLEKHSLLCQMRNKYRGPTPKNAPKFSGKRVLRILSATCVPPGGVGAVGGGTPGRLECACCTECFGKRPKDLIYQE